MMRLTAICLLYVLLAVSGTIQCAMGDEQAGQRPEDQGRVAKALELTQRVARTLRIDRGEDQATRLTLKEEPLQRFSNPIAGEFYAYLFIWTHDGRPEAAVAIQKWYSPKESLHVEMQSLALGPIHAEYMGEDFWHPKEAGVSFVAIPGSPQPARRAPARLREMRRLAREFRVHVKAPNRGNVDEDLRLLPQPIYRYKSKVASVQDPNKTYMTRLLSNDQLPAESP